MSFHFEDDPSEPIVYLDQTPRADLSERTAGLLIEIIPTGTPGKVYLDISNVGPEPLSASESVSTLRSAISMLELAMQDDHVVLPGFVPTSEEHGEHQEG